MGWRGLAWIDAVDEKGSRWGGELLHVLENVRFFCGRNMVAEVHLAQFLPDNLTTLLTQSAPRARKLLKTTRTVSSLLVMTWWDGSVKWETRSIDWQAMRWWGIYTNGMWNSCTWTMMWPTSMPLKTKDHICRSGRRRPAVLFATQTTHSNIMFSIQKTMFSEIHHKIHNIYENCYYLNWSVLFTKGLHLTAWTVSAIGP